MKAENLLFALKHGAELSKIFDVVELLKDVPKFVEQFKGDTEDALKSLASQINEAETAIYKLKKLDNRPDELNDKFLAEIFSAMILFQTAINDALDEE